MSSTRSINVGLTGVMRTTAPNGSTLLRNAILMLIMSWSIRALMPVPTLTMEARLKDGTSFNQEAYIEQISAEFDMGQVALLRACIFDQNGMELFFGGDPVLEPRMSYDDLKFKTPGSSDNVVFDHNVDLGTASLSPLEGPALLVKNGNEFWETYCECHDEDTTMEVGFSTEDLLHTQDKILKAEIKFQTACKKTSSDTTTSRCFGDLYYEVPSSIIISESLLLSSAAPRGASLATGAGVFCVVGLLAKLVL